MEFYGRAYQGKRDYNQDRIYHKKSGDSFIIAVADGMGGYSGGEIASQIAIGSCHEYFSKFIKKPDEKRLRYTIEKIVKVSNEKIRERAKENSELSEMGTTLTVVIGHKKRYVVGNVGDSRTYLISGAKIEQLTRDNSYVREYRDKHAESEIDDALIANMGHALTRSISGDDDPVDIYPEGNGYYELEEEDILLLCSDGLIVDKVYDDSSAILERVKTAGDIREAVDSLINWADRNGSTDNISVVIGSVGDWTEPAGKDLFGIITEKMKNRRVIPIAASFILVFIVAILLILNENGDKEVDVKQSKIEDVMDAPRIVWNDNWSETMHRMENLSWYIEATGKDSVFLHYREIQSDSQGSLKVKSSIIKIGDISDIRAKKKYEFWIEAFTEEGNTMVSDTITVRIEG